MTSQSQPPTQPGYYWLFDGEWIVVKVWKHSRWMAVSRFGTTELARVSDYDASQWGEQISQVQEKQ